MTEPVRVCVCVCVCVCEGKGEGEKERFFLRNWLTKLWVLATLKSAGQGCKLEVEGRGGVPA